MKPSVGGSENRSSGLLQQGIGAVLWGAAGSVTRIVLQIGSQIVLARLLGPDSYGVFAVALTVIFFASLFADLGLAYGLIQRPSVNDDDIRFVFTWQLLLAIASTAVLVAAAGPIATLLGDGRLAPVVRWLALGCILGSVGATAGMLLRRQLDFKILNIAAVVSYALGFVVFGIPMALLGFGVWSLVAAYLIQIATAAVLTYLSSPHAIWPLFRHADAVGMLGFGSTVLATNIVNWIMMSLDRLVIGATLQAAAAGLYATMSNIMSQPAASIITVVQSALYATSARAQDDRVRLQVAFRSMLGAVAVFLWPVFFAVGATAETLILATFGDKWAGGSTVLRPLAFAMPAYLLMGMAIPSLWVSGHTQWEVRLQIPIAVLWLIVLAAIAPFGSLALLSWTVCGLYYLRAAVIIGAAFRALQMAAGELVLPAVSGLIVTAVVTAAAVLADRSLAALGCAPLVALAGIIAACAMAAMAGLRLAVPHLSSDVRNLLAGVAERVPGGYGRFVLRRILGISP